MPSIAAKRNIRLNTDTNFLKLVAIVSMLIDHIGAALLPQYRGMRIIGRIAFPIFAYCLTVGSVYTHNMGKYLLRIAILALISQPVYVLALDHVTPAMNAISFDQNPVSAALKWYFLSFQKPNILVSLLAGLLIIFAIRKCVQKPILFASIFAGVLFLSVLNNGLYLSKIGWYVEHCVNYGLEGLILMVLFYLFCDQPLTSLICVAGYMIWWGYQGSEFALGPLRFGIQIFALLALPLIYIPMKTNLKINKYVFYFFYPLHLLAIFIVELIVKSFS